VKGAEDRGAYQTHRGAPRAKVHGFQIAEDRELNAGSVDVVPQGEELSLSLLMAQVEKGVEPGCPFVRVMVCLHGDVLHEVPFGRAPLGCPLLYGMFYPLVLPGVCLCVHYHDDLPGVNYDDTATRLSGSATTGRGAGSADSANTLHLIVLRCIGGRCGGTPRCCVLARCPGSDGGQLVALAAYCVHVFTPRAPDLTGRSG
jgi:hypothetical protein